MLQIEGTPDFKIQDIARSATVTRWHSVNCLRYPSIAEHSFLVAMYAREILERLNPNATAEEKLLLLEYCCFHDLPEVLTGDMATPVKRMLESMFPDGESPLDKIEEDLCPEYKRLKDEISGTYLAVVAKLADVLEAVKFIYVEGKSYVQSHDQNNNVLESMSQLTNIVSEFISSNSPENSEFVSNQIECIKNSFTKMIDQEKGDYIYGILSERKTNYEDRVQNAKEVYPEHNWEVALEVMNDLLYGKTTQIHFKDENH